jgi:hypothetical protein
MGLRVQSRDPFAGTVMEGQLRFRAKSAHKIYDKADEQNQPDTAAANHRAAQIKSTATEQQKENQHNN